MLLCGEYLTKYRINIASFKKNKTALCPACMCLACYCNLNTIFFCKLLQSCIIIYHSQAIGSACSNSQDQENVLWFSITVLYSIRVEALTVTGKESGCSHGVWYLLLARSVGFCFSKCSVQTNITVNIFIKNINRLLIFSTNTSDIMVSHRSIKSKCKKLPH